MWMRDIRGLLFKALVGGAGILSLPPTAYALVNVQDPVQREIQQSTGLQLSQEEILSRLDQSGLSRAQVQTQLTALGYDPAIANPYFDRLDGDLLSPIEQNADFLQAIAQMGILNEAGVPGADLDLTTLESFEVDPEVELELEPELLPFGQSVFERATTQFQPLAIGPVDPSYMLGPGDQIQLILTGDVELAYSLDVTREGLVVVPDVGQVFVNGLTLDDLRESLYRSLGAIYSGVRRINPTTRFHVSLGRLRTNQVFLIGEVSFPGAYQVNGTATVFNALYSAGGPSENGSMRSVQVRRGGNALRDVDLYDYLIIGDTSDDVRLEHGDLLFVPFAGPRVLIEGLVRRPAIYELREGEGLRDALGFAGGTLPDAYVQGVQVERILPVAERTPERERVLIDVNLIEDAGGEDFELIDGDQVNIPSISDRLDNRVALEGHVQRPGVFELTNGMLLSDLLDRSGGLLPDAFEAVAHLIRLVPTDSSYLLEQVSLDELGQPVADVQLRELDRVVIYGRSVLSNSALVSISGEVKNPGVFSLLEGMTAQDLLLAAGGFSAMADPYTAELARRGDALLLTDRIADSQNITFDRTLPSPLDMMESGDTSMGAQTAASASTVVLQDGDRVFVRRLQALRDEGDVQIVGEVLYPGPYPLEFRGEQVSSLIARAGGLTSEAYAAGARVIRDDLPVGLDLNSVLESPGGTEDLLLFPDDQLEIPQYDGTVLVLGEVTNPARAQWMPDMDFGEYLDQAGGLTVEADRNRASISYANGEQDQVSKFLFFRSDPDVEPGSTITVPVLSVEDGGGFDLDQWMSRFLSIATIVYMANQIR